MRSTRLRAALVGALLAATGGCSAGDPGPPAPPPPGPVPSSAATGSPALPGNPGGTAPAEASPAPTAARLVVSRSGGYAGRDDTVTVEPDGRWTAVDRAGARRTGRLAGADLDRLRRLAADPRLASGGIAGPDGRCSDAFEYRLTVGGVTVDWTDCPVAGTPPPIAAELAALVLTTAG
ncbi:hypothetical protein [Micromonospora okii]|uniref:hypothetical protein n=1 Tax=Micromonospora okii TaxID=1182970 RepID=UPI001E4DBE3E|nr:hypothetical protein [Micromonospora okii]